MLLKFVHNLLHHPVYKWYISSFPFDANRVHHSEGCYVNTQGSYSNSGIDKIGA